MSEDARLETIRRRHAELEEEISEELKRPRPDFTVLTGFKVDKLRLKEQMEGIRPLD